MNHTKRIGNFSSSKAPGSSRCRTPVALVLGSMIVFGCIMNDRSQATAADGLITRQDQRDDGLYSKKGIATDLRKGVADGSIDQEDADRIMALWERFAMGVESGRMTSQQARQKFDERMESMFKDGARKKSFSKDDSRSGRLGKFMIELGKAVEKGEISAEDAIMKVMDMAKRMDISMEGDRPGGKLADLRLSIEERLRALGADLRDQVEAGELTPEEARKRYEEGEKRMWSRFRAVEMQEGKVKGEERTRLMSREDFEAATAEMIEMVKAGKMTREQMQQKLGEMRKMMAAGEANDAEDQRRRRADYAAAEAKMAEMVKAGKITREEMDMRLDEMRRAMATEDQEPGKERELPRPPRDASPEEIREWFGRMKDRLDMAVESGRMSQEDAENMLRDIRMQMREKSR